MQHQLMVAAAELAHVFVFDGERGVLVELKREERSWNRIRNDWDVFMAFVAKNQPPPLTDRDTRKREDEAWKQATQAYIAAKRQADETADALEGAKERLIALAQHPSESGFGVTVTRYWKKGAVDYRRLPALKGLDLEGYRAPGREEVRISLSG